MARHTLYAYVCGSDLHAIAAELETHFILFVDGRRWLHGKPWVVNQRRLDDPTLGPCDLPDWDLGLNLDLPDPGNEPPGWFTEVEQIARFLGGLHSQFGREFVIGIADQGRGYSEDLFFVRSAAPDLYRLRQMIGVNERDKGCMGALP